MVNITNQPTTHHSDQQQPTCVYGLRNQTRTLCALSGDESKTVFLAGTLGLNGGGSDNELHLIEYDEETHMSTTNLPAAVFNHPHEISALCACPAPEFKHIISTSYNVVGDRNHRFRSTLWKLDVDVIDNLALQKNTHRLDLEPMVSFEDKWSKTGISQIKFDPSGGLSKIVGKDETQVAIYTLSEGLNTAMVSLQISIGDAGTTTTTKIHNLAWNPHSVGANVCATHGPNVSMLDIRIGKVVSNIVDGHGMHKCIRTLDYNPNKVYQLMTGGDDGKLRFWDVRHLDKCVHVEQGIHSHWITAAQYNPFHDQLVLSTSTDHSVQLASVSSISSSLPVGSVCSDSETDDTAAATNAREPLSDGVLLALDYHEDSVYGLAWSAADPWVFCSASYDGRVVVNHVPSAIKYKIIL